MRQNFRQLNFSVSPACKLIKHLLNVYESGTGVLGSKFSYTTGSFMSSIMVGYTANYAILEALTHFSENICSFEIM